jgi:hypothetical protein
MIHDDGRSYKVVKSKTCLIELLSPDGYTATGIKITHHAKLPRIYALVLATAPDVTEVSPGDFIIIRQHTWDSHETSTGITLYSIHVKRIRAIVDFSDQTGDDTVVAAPRILTATC